MKKYRSKRSRSWGLISGLLSLAMILAGVALIATFFFGQSLEDPATNANDPGGFNVPELDAPQSAEGGPEDKTLRLTVPKMSQIEDDTVPYVPGNDNEALGSHAAIHLEGTGFPWQEEANVYIAGHRLGYPNSDSFLAFFDLNRLENGDEVYVTDANDTRYTYRVFEETVVGPTDLSVTEPIPGKNIVTLQTCTLPDYSDRLIVQAELVEVS
ncbi:MAG: class E sortase [Rubrobacteraceae bacterium]